MHKKSSCLTVLRKLQFRAYLGPVCKFAQGRTFQERSAENAYLEVTQASAYSGEVLGHHHLHGLIRLRVSHGSAASGGGLPDPGAVPEITEIEKHRSSIDYGLLDIDR